MSENPLIVSSTSNLSTINHEAAFSAQNNHQHSQAASDNDVTGPLLDAHTTLISDDRLATVSSPYPSWIILLLEVFTCCWNCCEIGLMVYLIFIFEPPLTDDNSSFEYTLLTLRALRKSICILSSFSKLCCCINGPSYESFGMMFQLLFLGLGAAISVPFAFAFDAIDTSNLLALTCTIIAICNVCALVAPTIAFMFLIGYACVINNCRKKQHRPRRRRRQRGNRSSNQQGIFGFLSPSSSSSQSESHPDSSSSENNNASIDRLGDSRSSQQRRGGVMSSQQRQQRQQRRRPQQFQQRQRQRQQQQQQQSHQPFDDTLSIASTLLDQLIPDLIFQPVPLPSGSTPVVSVALSSTHTTEQNIPISCTPSLSFHSNNDLQRGSHQFVTSSSSLSTTAETLKKASTPHFSSSRCPPKPSDPIVPYVATTTLQTKPIVGITNEVVNTENNNNTTTTTLLANNTSFDAETHAHNQRLRTQSFSSIVLPPASLYANTQSHVEHNQSTTIDSSLFVDSQPHDGSSTVHNSLHFFDSHSQQHSSSLISTPHLPSSSSPSDFDHLYSDQLTAVAPAPLSSHHDQHSPAFPAIPLDTPVHCEPYDSLGHFRVVYAPPSIRLSTTALSTKIDPPSTIINPQPSPLFLSSQALQLDGLDQGTDHHQTSLEALPAVESQQGQQQQQQQQPAIASSSNDPTTLTADPVPHPFLRAPIECPICIIPFVYGDVLKELPCKHVFHAACVKTWISQSKAHHRAPRCPCCRSHALTGEPELRQPPVAVTTLSNPLTGQTTVSSFIRSSRSSLVIQARNDSSGGGANSRDMPPAAGSRLSHPSNQDSSSLLQVQQQSATQQLDNDTNSPPRPALSPDHISVPMQTTEEELSSQIYTHNDEDDDDSPQDIARKHISILLIAIVFLSRII